MKGHKAHKKARGGPEGSDKPEPMKGKTNEYQASTAPVVKDAKSMDGGKKGGGAVKKATGGAVGKATGGAIGKKAGSKVMGKMGGARADRRARGGGMITPGSNFSKAHAETNAKGETGASTNADDD